MYRKLEDSFLGSDGKTLIHYSAYIPYDDPKGIIQIAHGMAEHIGRYHHVAEHFVNRGFIVCGNDHLGHGKTAGRPEEFGYFGPEDGWVNMSEDIILLTKEMKDKYGNLPYFLIGHSMGSLLVRAALTKYTEKISGAILIGTSGENSAASTALPFLHLIKKAKGDRHRSRLVYRLAFGNYNKRYEKNCRRLSWMSQDDDVLDGYRDDPLCNFIFTVSGFLDLMKLLNFVSRKSWPREISKDLPIALLSGDMDPVGNFGEGTREVFKGLQLAGVEKAALKIYPDLRHEILNEPGKEKIYEDILTWINKNLSK